MSFLHKIWSFVSSPFSHPQNALQADIDAAGKVVDEAETLFDKFGAYAGVLPEPYKGFVAAFGLAIHNLDSYLDALETKPGPATPVAPPPENPTTPTPAPQPTASG